MLLLPLLLQATFQYNITDAMGQTSALTNVTVVVTPPPPPVAFPDTATVVSGGTVIISVLANDQGIAIPLFVGSVSTPSPAGTATRDGVSSTVAYTAPFGFSGTVRDLWHRYGAFLIYWPLAQFMTSVR